MLVWQSTNLCNLRCRHCFIAERPKTDLDTAGVRAVFENVARGLDPSQVRVAISGGEATIRRDLPEIVRHIGDLGFAEVGLASNGFLLGQHREMLDALVESGLVSLNVSLDGPAEYHNALRRHPKAYDSAMVAILHALRAHRDALDTTVTVSVSPGNFKTYPQVLDLAEQLGIRYAKIVSVMPYGDGAKNSDLGLSDEQLVQLLEDVAARREAFLAERTPLLVSMTCDGFLGRFEGASRSGLFNCPAGSSVAAILQDGRLSACAQLTQAFSVAGDLRTQPFDVLWRDGFRPFRDRRWLRKGPCERCEEWRYCQGGSLHDRSEEGELLRCHALRVRDAMEARREPRERSVGSEPGSTPRAISRTARGEASAARPARSAPRGSSPPRRRR